MPGHTEAGFFCSDLSESDILEVSESLSGRGSVSTAETDLGMCRCGLAAWFLALALHPARGSA